MNQATLNRHLAALAERDPHIAAGIELVGKPKPRVRPQGLETLLSIIAGQQISTEAAAAVMHRVRQCLPQMTAESLLDLPSGTLREAGFSNRKVEYAEGLARAIVEGTLPLARLTECDDEEAIDFITSLRGFGRWSAEIYLMFSLDRRDVFPADDLALLVALQKLKRMRARPTPKQARERIR
ncbi:MAG: DNA-3-methyladenine glycosylase 2 family protein, partial [Pseudomonadota bacterium]